MRQGAFILAAVKNAAAIAGEGIDHLRCQIKPVFKPRWKGSTKWQPI